MRMMRGSLLVQLLLLLALAASTGNGETCLPPPEPPSPMDPTLSPLELLDLGAAAVRYLRAFTTQCWLPDYNAPIAMFDNSWAVALVTIWNDLTVPSNGLGRLVTAMQLQMEASLMIEDKRPGDALSVLELAVLFTLYPVHHEAEALASWHRSLASNDTLFASRRLSLARTLALMSNAQASVGATLKNVDALEAAMVAGRAASELFAITDPNLVPPLPPPFMPTKRRNTAGTPEAVQRTLAEVLRNTARYLQDAGTEELERLLDHRGMKCRRSCGRRSALLKTLVPALRVPLRLVDGGSSGALRVEAAPELEQRLRPSRLSGGSEVGRLGSLFAEVVARLQQPLLSDIGIKCVGAGGSQVLHRCRNQAVAQFATWGGGAPAASDDMAQMLTHVMQVEEALWRLDQVLDGAMSGVRLGDGTTWVKNNGYAWVLGAYSASKLYPQGQGAPVYYQARRPSEPHVGSTICLDKTYLLDTVLRLDPEGLRGLQYALDNLHYAQFHAGGQEAFWRLLAKDNPLCSGGACRTGDDPLSLLVSAEAGAAVPAPPRPVMLDFRALGEQQLQANLAAATDPRARAADPFVAAFLSVCLVSCASLYLYSNRGRLVRALTPARGKGGGSPAPGASTLAQRNAATAALREALAGDNVSRQNVSKLHAAIDAAEAAGVEKPLVKKAKSALQALKKRKQQHGVGALASAGSQPRLQPTPRGGTSLSNLPSPSTSATDSGSTLSEHTAALLYSSATAGHESEWQELGSPGALPLSPGKAGGASRSSSGRSSTAHSPTRAAAANREGCARGGMPALSITPPPPQAARPMLEMPASPGTPAESLPRTSTPGSQAGASSDSCTPLTSPGRDSLAGDVPPPAAPAAAVMRAPSPGLSALPDAVVGVSVHPAMPAHGVDHKPAPSEDGSVSSAGGPAPSPRPLHRQLTPRQHKKLLRLQQKHAAAAAAAVAGQANGDGVAHAPDGRLPPLPPHPLQASRPGSASADGGSECADEPRQLSKKELQALAAREESAPSRQPRSAKKKAKAAAAGGSGSDGSVHSARHVAGVQAAGAAAAVAAAGRVDVRRTVSDPLSADAALGTLRSANGAAASRVDESLPLLDARARHLARWPASTCDSPGSRPGAGLNANAPEFSPSIHRALPPGDPRLGSPSPPPPPPQHPPHAYPPLSPEARAAASLAAQPGLRRSPFLAERCSPHMHRTQSLPFSPDSSLTYVADSGASSIDPQQSAVAAMAAAAAPAPGQPDLLSQLKQIWGAPGSGNDGSDAQPAFDMPLAPPTLAGAMLDDARQQQLAALLFMQHMEVQARLAGGAAVPGLGPAHGCDSAPLSPQQLPPASAHMLREVLGSPLALLSPGQPAASPPRGSDWGVGELARLDSSPALHSSLSLTGELAQAQLLALRQMGELSGELPALAVDEGALRPTAARSLAHAVHSAAQHSAPDLRRLSAGVPGEDAAGEAAARGAPLDGVPPDGGLRGHRIDSLDLEALGFTESGE